MELPNEMRLAVHDMVGAFSMLFALLETYTMQNHDPAFLVCKAQAINRFKIAQAVFIKEFQIEENGI